MGVVWRSRSRREVFMCMYMCSAVSVGEVSVGGLILILLLTARPPACLLVLVLVLVLYERCRFQRALTVTTPQHLTLPYLL